MNKDIGMQHTIVAFISLAIVVIQLFTAPLPAAPAKGVALEVDLLAGGDHSVGNGGGLAEQLVLIQFRNLPRSIELCLALPSCLGDNQHQRTLMGLKGKLGALFTVPDLIRFIAVSDPGFARALADAGQSFHTTKQTGAPIFINRNLLYFDSGTGLKLLLSQQEALILVVQALLFQTSDLDRSQALAFAGAFADGIGRHGWESLTVGLGTHAVHIPDPAKRLQVLALQAPASFGAFTESEVLLKDSSGYYPLTDLMKASIGCADGPAQGIRVGNLRLIGTERKLAVLKVAFGGELYFICPESGGLIQAEKVLMTFKFQEQLVTRPLTPGDISFRWMNPDFSLDIIR